MQATDDSKATGFSSTKMALPLPRTFGRLVLLRLLARGGADVGETGVGTRFNLLIVDIRSDCFAA